MPSWNIHTAHVEKMLADHAAADLGIADENIFLFGNYVPDIYLGFMVDDTTYRLDYCLTHLAEPAIIPLPDSDKFWDECICHAIRRPSTETGLSLVLGAWAHLVADRRYNASFRAFCENHDVPSGDELRIRKQADFSLFGHSLDNSRCVSITPELLEAAKAFRPYSILPADVERTVDVATAIVHEEVVTPSPEDYRLLGSDWMNSVFAACDDEITVWLQTWQRLRAEDAPYYARDIRAELE